MADKWDKILANLSYIKAELEGTVGEIVAIQEEAERARKRQAFIDGLEPFSEDHICPKCLGEAAAFKQAKPRGDLWAIVSGHQGHDVPHLEVICNKCGHMICRMKTADWGEENE